MKKGLSLEAYALAQGEREPPAAEREQMRIIADDLKDREADRRRAGELISSIAQQIDRGERPEYILYAALEAISLLTRAPEWAAQLRAKLDATYSDLAQQSLLADNTAVAERRLAQRTGEYNAKLRRALQRQLAGYKRIARDIGGALDELDALEALNAADAAEDDELPF